MTSNSAIARPARPYTGLTVAWAGRFYLQRLTSWPLLMLLPAIVLAVSSLCEALLWKQPETSTLIVLLQYAIGAVRILAFGMGMASITWFTAAALIEDIPSPSEALHAGWQAAWSSGMACLPLWVLLLVYALCTGLFCRAAAQLFRVTGTGIQVLAVTFVLLCAAPLPLLVVAKHCFIVPVAVLGRQRGVQAALRAGALLPWRGFWLVWPYALPAAILACLGLLLPSLLYVSSLWDLLGLGHATIRAMALRHALALFSFTFLGSLAACVNTLFYCAFYPPWRLPTGQPASGAATLSSSSR
ncbi:MAG: hypothetical protein N2595_05305 [bacterium]|nr:hypothetical protein [bacterium]